MAASDKHILYKTSGTCSQYIDVSLDADGLISQCVFHGGCNGNTKGISILVKGQRPEDVIARLKGISCGARPTSCPDQLSKALEELLQK